MLKKEELSRNLCIFAAEMSKNLYIIIRRYYEGIDNLFRIYMPIVDTWMLIDNSVTPRGIIATGGCGQELVINNEVEYKKIEAYVKH